MELNLGIRGHDVDFAEPQQIAEEVSSKGLHAVQLALAKSFKNIPTETGTLSPGYAKYMKHTFKQQDIDIAILGCYINMIHPHKEKREQLLARFKEHIRFARDFGCSIVASETGNINEKMGYTEDNFTEEAFQKVVSSVKELTDEAEKWGVIVGIEGGINHPIHTPQKMKRLIDEVDSNHLQVIFDPANFMSMENYEQQEDVFAESFELFGDRIIAIHAKDFVIEDNWIKMVPVGKGLLNYPLLFEWLKEHKPYIEVLLENTKEPYINDSIRYLKEKYSSSTQQVI
ncbi:sugar phosphate isomerase/epimerase family protein [Gracilibacillus sp. S3-1-1]|uniref:Sugar phosphate isomerase/epimerase family protein n=1 Tax=Gracilibacillus pellucidus TaxID=3095368 RepID=A0ACC6M2I2_9BACI|nr:sugar phosphate isomerase/epimerase family protein [Gracilibacillus sp. S3-1-1]MDX8045164.1 sugar phosphate isomerase/epimerase family protein [Gracilibacillus sp. S3-1-1]